MLPCRVMFSHGSRARAGQGADELMRTKTDCGCLQLNLRTAPPAWSRPRHFIAGIGSVHEMRLFFNFGAAATLLFSFVLLAGCTTPYCPPVQVAGSASFTGLNAVIAENAGNPVDVILVHGMCTKTDAWAHFAVDAIMAAITPGYAAKPGKQPPPPAGAAIRIVHRDEVVRGAPIRFSSLIWSPPTAGLKHQLEFDRTGTATDCAVDGECRPRRARLNGMLKDGLLNDCLSDAIIYQGDSRESIRQKMIEALDATFVRQQTGPLILVT